MKSIGQIVGATIVGIVCLCLLPLLIPVIVIYAVIAVIRAVIVAVIAASVIKAKSDKS